MKDDLSGKVALVTGGSSGFGAAIVSRLGRAGAKVTISYFRDAEGAERLADALIAEGCVAGARQADHDDPEAAAACVDAVVQQKGRLDILVNNAAVGEPAQVQDVTVGTAEQQFRINLIAPLMAIRVTAPHMIGDPEDIAETVTFLGGPAAAWITGAVLPCSRGLS